jgi:TolA-binding protein
MVIARQMAGVVCGILLVASGARADGRAYAERMQFADGLYSRAMHALALKEYTALLRDFPAGEANDAVTFRMAEALRHLKRNDEAAQLFDKLFVTFPSSEFRLRAAYRRARLYMEVGDYEAAAEHFKAIVALQPPASLAAACFYYLGESLLARDRPGEAEAAFGVVVKRHPASMFRVYALMKQGDIQQAAWRRLRTTDHGAATNRITQAIASYAEVLKHPGSPRIGAEALFQTAEIYFRLRDFDRSAAHYRRLLNEYPDDERSDEARLQAAWAACNAGLYADALGVAERAMQEPALRNLADWQYLTANCQRQLLRYDLAVVAYGELLTRFPASRFAEAARYELALSFYKMERYTDAVREAQHLASSAALQADVNWLLAESYAALNQPEQAIQHYRLVLRQAPKSERSRDATYRLAYHLQTRGALAEASRFYHTLVEQFPDDKLAPQALFASGVCLAKAGSHAEAARDWAQLARAYPRSEQVEEALYQKAMSEIRIARDDDALRTLDGLLQKFPKGRFVADVYYWRGMVHGKGDRLQDAEAALRKAIAQAKREDLAREAEYSLGVVLQKAGKEQEAAERFRKLLDTGMSARFGPTQLEWLSGYYQAQGQGREALQAAGLLLKNAPEALWQQAGWVLSARAHRGLKQAAEAETALRKALDVKAETVYGAEAALALGNLLLERDKLAEARTYFENASHRASSDRALGFRARAYFGLAQCADRQDDHVGAARYYMSVAILFDDPELVPESLYLASIAFTRAGHAEDAATAIAELRERYPKSEWAERTQPATVPAPNEPRPTAGAGGAEVG